MSSLFFVEILSLFSATIESLTMTRVFLFLLVFWFTVSKPIVQWSTRDETRRQLSWFSCFVNFNCTRRVQNYLIEHYTRVLGWLARKHTKNMWMHAIGKQDKYFQRNQWLCSCDVSLHSSMRCYYYLYFHVKWMKERDRFYSLAHREWEQWPIHLWTWQIVSFTFCLRASVCTSLCLCTMFDTSRRRN